MGRGESLTKTLAFQEFKMLAQHSASYNAIIDYIPLHEITLVDYELKAKDNVKGDSANSLQASSLATAKFEQSMLTSRCIKAVVTKRMSLLRMNFVLTARAGSKNGFISKIESITGWDIDGDGQADKTILPLFDPGMEHCKFILNSPL